MTSPEQNPTEEPEGTGVTGALGAASTDHDDSDPLGPLDRITEDGDDEESS